MNFFVSVFLVLSSFLCFCFSLWFWLCLSLPFSQRLSLVLSIWIFFPPPVSLSLSFSFFFYFFSFFFFFLFSFFILFSLLFFCTCICGHLHIGLCVVLQYACIVWLQRRTCVRRTHARTVATAPTVAKTTCAAVAQATLARTVKNVSSCFVLKNLSCVFF